MRTSATAMRSRATAIVAAAADLGFGPLAGDDAAEGLALTARLMKCEVAPRVVLDMVLARQPSGALGLREAGRITGVVATLLVGATARRDLEAGVFDGRSDLSSRVCGYGEKPAAYYIWGVAGETRRARWAAMELCQRLRFDVLADLTAFTRAATEEGRRAATARLGFGPLRGAGDNWLVSPAVLERLAA